MILETNFKFVQDFKKTEKPVFDESETLIYNFTFKIL